MALTLLDFTDYTERKLLLEALGFYMVSNGSFKRCYMHDNCPFVVKLSCTFGPDALGMLESTNYLTAPDDIRHHLLPILAEGPDWQLQAAVDRNLEWRVCPADCPVRDYHDMWNKSHVHYPDGTIAVFDYGQRNQWVKD